MGPVERAGKPECPLCCYLQAQNDRLMTECARLRVEVADGPRARVRELESALERVNAQLARHNGKGKR